METGIKGKKTIKVTEELSAKVIGSGSLEVFATPAMIALMENTASESVEPYLEDGQGTVGTMVHISHSSATAVGEEVTCETVLTEIDRKRFVFTCKVYDKAGLIGEGTHERFIIDNQKFMDKVRNK